MPFSRPVFPETASLLRRIHRQSKHYQVRQRAHCIVLRSQGYGINSLMEIFDISRKTLYNWFKSWDERGLVGLYNRPGQGRKPTFSREQQEQIRQWVSDTPRQLKPVVEKIQAKWNIRVSTKTIKRVLDGLKMSWHRFRRVTGGQPDPEVYAAKKSELEDLQQLEAAGELDLYYLDETGFCLVPYIPYGWQPVGETIELPSQGSPRLNVLGFMTRSNQLEAYVSQQTITSEVVIACIDTFFAQVTRRTVIVVDQASIHTSDAIQDKLEEWQERQIEIFQLPSYSPELNLIEILWRFIKYEWIDFHAYQSWQSLNQYVEKVLREFGTNYVIHFA